MTFGSLFAGIGGIDLGLERAGMTCKWQVEKDEFCRKVLEKHWPDVMKFGDIRDVTAEHLEPVDLLAGGFPCQDISYAGKGAGIEGERSGLWSEYARLIGELRPRYVLVENVAALLGRGIDRVLGDLSEIGYDAEWETLSAAYFGAIHQRERVFLVAYPRIKRVQRIFSEAVQGITSFSWCEDVRGVEDLRGRSDLPEPLFRGSCDGVPDWMDRLRGIGNAVVPQCAEFVGRLILDAETEGKVNDDD